MKPHLSSTGVKAACFVLPLSLLLAADHTYHAVDLGIPFGANGVAYGINNQGEIVGGYRPLGASTDHGFLWRKGRITDIGDLGSNGAAVATNNRGEVVGRYVSSSSLSFHAFLWEPRAGLKDLGTLGGIFAGFGTYAEAAAINERGQVVGSPLAPAGQIHGFLWERGVMIDLGGINGLSSQAHGINNRGQVVGVCEVRIGSLTFFHACLWENGVWSDLGVPGPDSKASAINESGEVTGAFTSPDEWRAFLWRKGRTTNLGTLGNAPNETSAGLGINNRGQVVGWSTNGGLVQAFLWEKGIMLNLSPSLASAIGATAINESGVVAGDIQDRPVLWEKQ
jgi:probable HAF family extracellular repeat protein